MLEELKSRANSKILENQKEKQKLYDRISELDNELVEYNEILSKFEDRDSILNTPPKEAFNLLEKLGYTDKSELLDNYLELIRTIELERDNELLFNSNYFDF